MIATATQDFHQQIREGRRVLSYSQINTWASCRHRWFYLYGLGIQRREPSERMALGDVVHKALADVFSSGGTADFRESCRRWAEDVMGLIPTEHLSNDTIDTFVAMGDTASGIVERILALINNAGWNTLILDDGRPAVELELTAPLPEMRNLEHFAGHIDWLAKDPEGRVWLVDFKIRSKLSPTSYEQVNFQHSVYHYLATMHGIRVDGTVTFEVKNELPSKPKLNKNGTMSRVAGGTDWPTYRAALAEAKLPEWEYEDMKEKLESNRFHQLLVEWRNPETSRRIWERVVLPAAREIDNAYEFIDLRKFPPFVWRNMGSFQCSGCPVQSLCFGVLHDYDVQPLLAAFSYSPDVIAKAIKSGWLEI